MWTDTRTKLTRHFASLEWLGLIARCALSQTKGTTCWICKVQYSGDCLTIHPTLASLARSLRGNKIELYGKRTAHLQTKSALLIQAAPMSQLRQIMKSKPTSIFVPPLKSSLQGGTTSASPAAKRMERTAFVK